MAKGTWNDERVELLKELWGAGKTAAEIAQQLGGNITRNAVIGKAHRLGLSGRVSPIQKKPKRSSASSAGSSPAASSSSAPVQSAPRVKETYVDVPRPNGGVSLMELKEKMCHWPIGDPKKAGFHFCGDRSVPGLPYCGEHASVAYQGSVKRFSVNAADIAALSGGNNAKSDDALDLLDDALNA